MSKFQSGRIAPPKSTTLRSEWYHKHCLWTKWFLLVPWGGKSSKYLFPSGRSVQSETDSIFGQERNRAGNTRVGCSCKGKLPIQSPASRTVPCDVHIWRPVFQVQIKAGYTLFSSSRRTDGCSCSTYKFIWQSGPYRQQKRANFG